MTANPQSRLVTELDPLLTYRITAGQLFNGDGFSGALARERGDAPGNYAITQGSLAASDNYALTLRRLDARDPRAAVRRPEPQHAERSGSSGHHHDDLVPAAADVSDHARHESAGRAGRAPTQVAAVTPTDPTVTGTVNANQRVLTYLPISQFEAREYIERNIARLRGSDGRGDGADDDRTRTCGRTRQHAVHRQLLEHDRQQQRGRDRVRPDRPARHVLGRAGQEDRPGKSRAVSRCRTTIRQGCCRAVR